MAKITQLVLSASDQDYLNDFVKTGKRSARSIRRAHTLLLLAEGKLSPKQIAAQLGCVYDTVYRTIKRYQECAGDVRKALLELPRPGQPTKITPEIEAHITALACSQSGPEGSGRSTWTLRLMAGNLVELGHIDSISYETIRGVLKKVYSSPGSKSSGALVK